MITYIPKQKAQYCFSNVKSENIVAYDERFVTGEKDGVTWMMDRKRQKEREQIVILSIQKEDGEYWEER